MPARLFGHSLLEANLRKKYNLNVISVKNGPQEEYGLFTPEYRFRPGDVVLISGTDKSLDDFAGVAAKDHAKRRKMGVRDLGKLFHIGRK